MGNIIIELFLGAKVCIPYWKYEVTLEIVYRANCCLFCLFNLKFHAKGQIIHLRTCFSYFQLLITLEEKLNNVSELIFIVVNDICFQIYQGFSENRHFSVFTSASYLNVMMHDMQLCIKTPSHDIIKASASWRKSVFTDSCCH